MRSPFLFLALLGSVLLGSAGASADSGFTPAQRAEIVQIMRDALERDPSILRDAIDALQQDETARQAASARGAITAARAALLADPADPIAGNPHGDVTVVEFYDPRCPYCRRLLPTLDQLLRADPGLRLVFKDIPILGPDSVVEAKAVLAAQRQGGYVRLQQALMRDSAPPTPEMLRTTAAAVGLDPYRLMRDMADPAIQRRIDDNLALARALHVDGTPALVIGEQMIPGAVGLAELQAAVAAARR